METKEKELIERSSLSAKTYNLIKKLIISRKISGKFGLDQIANMIGVSKTPVISAITRLEAEGVILNIPYKGYSIKEHSKKEIEDIFELRILFESLGIEKLIENITEKDIEKLNKFIDEFENYNKKNNLSKYRELDYKFHRYIVEQTKNELIINQYNNQVIIPVMIGTFLSIEESIKHHREIIDNILQKNLVIAKNILKKHIGSVMKNKMDFLKEKNTK